LGEAFGRNADRDLPGMKGELMGAGEIIIEEVKGRDGELMDFEKEAISRWKNMDRKIDEYAERIGDNVLELKSRALNINNVLERHEEKLENLEEGIDQANEELETSTKRLKKLIVKVRSGDKFCCTLCLLIILIGLIVVAYNIIQL
jgi:chromosome segregation ATPase